MALALVAGVVLMCRSCSAHCGQHVSTRCLLVVNPDFDTTGVVGSGKRKAGQGCPHPMHPIIRVGCYAATCCNSSAVASEDHYTVPPLPSVPRNLFQAEPSSILMVARYHVNCTARIWSAYGLYPGVQFD
ncbi:hypothetical protein EDB84DRAFT_1446664 [Lactarius hengduanensis]|nr:hypothetical protein EDB84DRAFT_1446664 [Lactarius hengduanensis]